MSQGSCNINLNIDVDVNELITQATGMNQRSSYNDRYFDDNKGRFISMQRGGKIIACCFHKTKNHSTTGQVHNKVGQLFVGPQIVRQAQSTAPPGRWAIAYCDSGRLGGDQTFYDTW